MNIPASARKVFYSHRRVRLAIVVLFVLLMPACRLVNSSSETMPPALATAAKTAEPAAIQTEQPIVTPSIPVTESATPTGTTPGPTEPSPSREVGPSAAMLPAFQADLSRLLNVPKYEIDLQIDPSLASFSGRVDVTYTNLEDTTLDRLYFRLLPNGRKSYGNGSLTAAAVSIGGEPVETRPVQDDPSVLEVVLPEVLPAGESIRLAMEFTGKVPVDFGGGETPSGYGIYNLTDGVLALSGWYPILAAYDEDGWNLDQVSEMGDSVYSDTAFYTVNICAPGDLILAATGVETERQPDGDRLCVRYESGPTRDFMLMGSRDYQVISGEADGVTVNSYYRPGHEKGAQAALDISVKSLEIYNEKFGAYPFVELDVMDAPMRNALGVEYPGIILVASSLYDEPGRDDFVVATAHEVGHQWWYSVVGNDVFEEPWLDEALTTFTSSLYYEYGRSRGASMGLWEYWQSRYDRLVQSGRDDPVAESLAYFEVDPAQHSYSTVVYVKGGLFFRALRQEIGDQAFFTALQEYYRAHKYGIARGSELLDSFEAAAGRPLDAFYQEWLFAR